MSFVTFGNSHTALETLGQDMWPYKIDQNPLGADLLKNYAVGGSSTDAVLYDMWTRNAGTQVGDPSEVKMPWEPVGLVGQVEQFAGDVAAGMMPDTAIIYAAGNDLIVASGLYPSEHEENGVIVRVDAKPWVKRFRDNYTGVFATFLEDSCENFTIHNMRRAILRLREVAPSVRIVLVSDWDLGLAPLALEAHRVYETYRASAIFDEQIRDLAAESGSDFVSLFRLLPTDWKDKIHTGPLTEKMKVKAIFGGLL